VESENQYGRRRIVKKQLKHEKPAEPKKEQSTQPPAGRTSEKPEKKENKPVAHETRQTKRSDSRPPSRSPRKTSRPRTGRPPRTDRPDRKPRTSERRPTAPSSKTRKPTANRSRTSGVKLSVVIPAFNEEGNIAALLIQFDKMFSNLPYRSEMILVDDGSTDKTALKIKESKSGFKWLKVETHRINQGLTAALETGFSKASGQLICFYPADLQYHANEIPKLVSKIDSGADIVTGWKQGNYGLKSFGSYIYNVLSRMLFKIKVHDLNSIKVFRKDITQQFVYRRGWHRYMVVMANMAGYKVDEVKVKLYERHSGNSKFGFLRLPRGFLDLLSVKFQLSFTRKPLLFFGSAGIISVFLGFVTGVIALYMRFVEHAGFRPLLYMVILLVVSGLMLFAIGFLAELIVSIKDDLSRRKRIF